MQMDFDSEAAESFDTVEHINYTPIVRWIWYIKGYDM
jgi:hypothetical protein